MKLVLFRVRSDYTNVRNSTVECWLLIPLVADVERNVEERLEVADGAGLQHWDDLLARLPLCDCC